MQRERKTKPERYFTLTKWWFSSLALVIVFFVYNPATAQLANASRFEIQLEEDDDVGYEVIPAAEQGTFLVRTLAAKKLHLIELTYLDTAFNLQWKGSIPVEKDYFLVNQRYANNNIYLLFRYHNYTRNDLIMFIVNRESGDYYRHNIRGYIPFSPSDFQVLPDAVLIGGYFNRTPVVLHYSLQQHTSKVLPGLLNEAGELNQIKVNDNGTFDVLISAMNWDRQKVIWIKSYDEQANLINNYALDSSDKKHLIFGQLINTNKNMQVVAGVYGKRSTEYSRGVFVSSIDPSGLQQIKYYDFSDLENFFKYMKVKREQRIKEKIERRKIKGKKIRFNYRFIVHQIIPYQDQFLLLGEAFYPKYSYAGSSSMFSPFAFSYGTVQNGRIFEGFYYTHAVIMAFNSKGQLLWDNSFEINDVRTFNLKQFVKAEIIGDRVFLSYLFEGKIRNKIIQGNKVIEGKTEDYITTGVPGEIVKTEKRTTENLDYWFGRTLQASGIQNVEIIGAKSKRRVFYINKISPTAPNF